MIDPTDKLYKDFNAVKQIPIVPNMLDVICQITGMGFAAVARVTQDRWLACSVNDKVQFGLEEGGELEVETTLCHEVRHMQQPIVIDHVDADNHYRDHHTPKIYGLQSYISVPIFLRDGTFFGTLCAIDSKPAHVNNPKVIQTFMLFAELLSFHLQSLELLEDSVNENIQLKQQNKILSNANFDLDNFVLTASHDLKSPISNLEGLIEIMDKAIQNETIDRAEILQINKMMQLSFRRFAITIKDLTAIVEADVYSSHEKYEQLNIFDIVRDVKRDLNSIIKESKASIYVDCPDDLTINFSKKNLKSILYNLTNNAIKYQSPVRYPEVLVQLNKVADKIHLSVADNGLGIPSDKKDKVFNMFNRLHDHVEGTGLGLYIVKRIIDNANGEISVESTLNEGSRFNIIL